MALFGKAYEFSIAGLLLIVATGCEDKQPAAHAARARTATAQPAKEPDLRTVAALLDKQSDPAPHSPAPAMPPGHPPIGAQKPAKLSGALPAGHPPIEPPPPPGEAPGDLKFTAPSNWKQSPVTSAMRKAQFALPKAAGDLEDGQLVAFYFGRDQGGTVELNIARWKSMFTTAAGKPVDESNVKRETTQVDGMNVTLLDVSGRYADQMGRPSQAGPTEKDFRMLAAIVETPDGPWFFKAVGPTATMTTHAPAFQEFVRGIHK